MPSEAQRPRQPAAADVAEGLMPKRETQALDFLRQHPSYDGRGVVVGILDTGVDPGAPGLQTTPDGRPKIISVVDCTGSGDVDTSRVVRAGEDGTFVGATGRTIRVNPQWPNPSGDWHVGLKAAFELYPRGLIDRVREKRKEKWVNEQRVREAELLRQLTALQQQQQGSPLSSSSDADLKRKIQNVQDQLDVLRDLDKSYSDPGPVYDCIVFHDGQHWRAVVDTTETGDVSGLTPMTNFSIERQYSTFSDLDSLNFAVNIYDNGTVLSIVVDAGSHGTHVAGIVSAYFPDQPELNGVAPGAQIVSLKIGDTRLGSMETGVGLVRALIEAKRHGCHVINMSYGEATSSPDAGRFIELADQLVYKHGVIFVASAGNNGPCISTVGAPGGTTSGIMGIAAYVSQTMMLAAYSLPTTVPDTNFTWSSSGPTLAGGLGVSVTAPGAAIAPVPNWTWQKNMLMNGTSMSSPNATGNIALLLSGLLQQRIPYSPVRVRRAVENTARMVPDVEPFSQGNGLLQVANAFEHLVQHKDYKPLDVHFKVEVTMDDAPARGIYLREVGRLRGPSAYNVTIDPTFHEDTPPNERFSFDMRVKLESSADWVVAPKYLALMHGGRSFEVSVDPTSLPPGVHMAFVRGFDEQCEAVGPLFSIPVTIVVPEPLPSAATHVDFGTLNLAPNERFRRFIAPPAGCTWVDITVRDTRVGTAAVVEQKVGGEESKQGGGTANQHTHDDDGGDEDGNNRRAEPAMAEDSATRVLLLHTVQAFEQTPYRDHEKRYRIALSPGQVVVKSVPCTPEVIMEVTLARFWSTFRDTSVEFSVHFRGLMPSPEVLCIQGGEYVQRVRLTSHIHNVEASPTAKLTKWQQKIRPRQAHVLPLGERDVLLDGKPIHQLVLEYEFEQEEPQSVTPRWPGLNGLLYDSGFEAQFYMVYDKNKRLLGCGDAWPSAVKVGKGKHVIRLQVRHDQIPLLEKLKTLPVLLERPLKSKEISLTFYAKKETAMTGGAKMPTRMLSRGKNIVCFVRQPDEGSWPKEAAPGDILLGHVMYEKKNDAYAGSRVHPDGFPVTFVVPPAAAASSGPSPSSSASSSSSSSSSDQKAGANEQKEADVSARLSDAVRDAKVKFLRSVLGTSAFDQVFDGVFGEYPEHLPVRCARLDHLVKRQLREGASTEELQAIVDAADAVRALINEAEVARILGLHAVPDDPEAVKRKQTAKDEQKTLAEALATKCRALLLMLRSAAASGGSEATEQLFKATYRELQNWADVTQDEYWQLHTETLRREGNLGSVLKKLRALAQTCAEKKCPAGVDPDALDREILALYNELGWAHAADYHAHTRLVSRPASYALF